MSAGGLLAVAVSGRGLVDPGEPVLAPDDEGFTRGRAAFETMRVYDGRPFRLAAASRSSSGLGRAHRARAARRRRVRGACGARARAGGNARGGAPALLDAGAARRRASGDRPRRRRSRTGSRMRALGASASSRCCTRAARRRGFSPPRSRRATPSPWRPSPRPRRAARTMPCSSTRTGSCSRAGDEHLVARGRRPRDAVARGRHPRRRDPRRSPRACAAWRTRRRGRRLPARTAPRAPTRHSRRRRCAR